MEIRRHGSILLPVLVLIMLLVSATLAHAAGSLALSVMVDHDPVQVGEGFRIEVRVANRGDAPLSGVSVELPYPTEFPRPLSGSQISDGGRCIEELSAGDEIPPVAKSSFLNWASTDSCLTGITVHWDLGDLPAGASRSRFLTISTGSPGGFGSAGEVVDLTATASASDGQQATARHALLLVDEAPLSLRAWADHDPVAAGSRLAYTLNYGNRGQLDATGGELRVGLPAGVAFVSASDGGRLLNGEVVWNLGGLRAGEVGRRRLLVDVDAGLASGSLLKLDAARLRGELASTTWVTRAAALTSVAAPGALTFRVLPVPGRLHPDSEARILLAVGNRGDAFADDVTFYLGGCRV